MHRKRIYVLILACLVGISIACSALSPTNPPNPTPYLTAEAENTAFAATQQGNVARATELQGTINAVKQGSINQTATEEQQIAEAEATAAQRQANLEAARAESTAQAQAMQEVVQNLYAEGNLETTDGIYNTIADFDESWAQIDWYQWSYTGYSPTDFVIRANAAWDSASERANLFNSGCGFVFREDGTDNHYLAYLGMDGYVYFDRNVHDRGAMLGFFIMENWTYQSDRPKSCL